MSTFLTFRERPDSRGFENLDVDQTLTMAAIFPPINLKSVIQKNLVLSF